MVFLPKIHPEVREEGRFIEFPTGEEIQVTLLLSHMET